MKNKKTLVFGERRKCLQCLKSRSCPLCEGERSTVAQVSDIKSYFILLFVLLSNKFKPNRLLTPENKAKSTTEPQSLHLELPLMPPLFSKLTYILVVGRQGLRKAAHAQKYIINIAGFMRRPSH